METLQVKYYFTNVVCFKQQLQTIQFYPYTESSQNNCQLYHIFPLHKNSVNRVNRQYIYPLFLTNNFMPKLSFVIKLKLSGRHELSSDVPCMMDKLNKISWSFRLVIPSHHEAFSPRIVVFHHLIPRHPRFSSIVILQNPSGTVQLCHHCF